MDFNKEARELIREVINILSIEMDSEFNKQILGGFLFGVINSLAYDRKKDLVDVQEVMLSSFENDFKYKKNQASDFLQYLLEATVEENNPIMFAIIHRGLEAYYDLYSNKVIEFIENYEEILSLIKEN